MQFQTKTRGIHVGRGSDREPERCNFFAFPGVMEIGGGGLDLTCDQGGDNYWQRLREHAPVLGPNHAEAEHNHKILARQDLGVLVSFVNSGFKFCYHFGR